MTLVFFLTLLITSSKVYAAESCARLQLYVVNQDTGGVIPNAQVSLRCNGGNDLCNSALESCPATEGMARWCGDCWEDSGTKNIGSNYPYYLGSEGFGGYDCLAGNAQLDVDPGPGWNYTGTKDGSGNNIDPGNLSLSNGATNVVKVYYTPTCSTSCERCTKITTCGIPTYDTCRDNLSQTGSNICKNGAATFTCQALGNSSCTSGSTPLNCSDFSACSPPPSTPLNPTQSCTGSAPTVSLNWDDVSGATSYNLRVDEKPPNWDGSCLAPDRCLSPTSSAYAFTGIFGKTYNWWVHSCNAYGCTGAATFGTEVACTAPPAAPTNLSASCPAPGTTATVSWTNGSGATTHNVRINNTANGWNGSCTSPNPGDFCFDNASSPKGFSSAAGATYGWWVDACNSAGCTTGSGTNFTCAQTPTLAVQCSVSPTSTTTGQNVTWTASVLGGTSPFTYAWSGTDTLQGTTGNPATLSYSTAGIKTGAVRVTDAVGTAVGPVNCNSVTITAPPDLIVNNLSPVSAVEGASVSFSGRVVNQGNASAGASSTRLRYDSNRDNTLDTTLTNQPTGTLAAGGTETETWSTVTFSTAGNYLYEICADIGGAVAESNEANNCTTQTLIVNPVGTPPAPTVSTIPACISSGYTGSEVTINWSNLGVTWVNIDSDSGFATPFYHKCVNTSCEASSTTTSTTGPSGFNANDGSGALSLNPTTTYFVRTFNDTQHSNTASFNIPACTLAPTVDLRANGVDGPITIANSTSALLTWTTTNSPTSCTASNTWSGSKTISGGNESTGALTGPNAFTYALTCTNTSGTNSDSVTVNVNAPSAPVTGNPWIQTINGDVHSNTEIKVGN